MIRHKAGQILTACALIAVLCGGLLWGSGMVANGKAIAQELSACDEIPYKELWEVITYDQDTSAEWATDDTSCYAWDAFLAFNLPSAGKGSSEPDFNKPFGDAPVVWEGWKESSEVYLPNGAPPTPWGSPRQVPQQVIEKAEKMGLPLDQPFHNLGLIQQVSGLVFKSSEDNNNEPIRYELAMDESTFDFINENNPYGQPLYNLNGQEEYAQRCRRFRLPQDWDDCLQFDWDAVEVKTSWLWLANNPQAGEIEDRYITANGYYQKFNNDGTPVMAGGEPVYEVSPVALTGMHIVTKALKQWVWTTFENVYNADYTPATIENPIPDDAQEANKIFGERVADTKYANYELVGTQINFIDPELLANSQIETNFQKNSSCITCHAIAAIATTYEGPLRLSFVDNEDGNLTYYVGELTEDVQEQLHSNFMPMDFVWSMRLAKRDRSN
ncbi:MAG: hypothetical protein AB4290_16135 [Spirulina sp.]